MARIMFAKLWLICVALVALADTCQAHDIYSHLTDRADRSCCNNGDCRPAQYRTTPSGVEMLIADKWIAIPRGKLQYRILNGDTGETAGGHWCGAPDESGTFSTYCAILPPSTALVDD
jgi:hypothetical protein